MIASLKGTVIEVLSKFMILDVNGVGYKVEGSFDQKLNNTELFIYVHIHYSENDTRLFGFLTKDEFVMFELLLSVAGVGPKLALALISNLGVGKIKNGIISARPNDLKGKGVGLKTAQKIVIELAGKFDNNNSSIPMEILSKDEQRKLNEVQSALLNLGYTKIELDDILETLMEMKDEDPEMILRTALNLLKKIKHNDKFRT